MDLCSPNVAGPRASEGRRGKKIELLWFGDCGALLATEKGIEVIGESFAKRARESAGARAIAKEKKISPAAGLSRQEFIGHLRKARNFVNSGGNWLFSPDHRAADHVSHQLIAAPPEGQLLLASDGFLALVGDYGAYDAASLMTAARDKGLAALGQELRAIEEADPLGDKYARFKKSDDATAVLLKIG